MRSFISYIILVLQIMWPPLKIIFNFLHLLLFANFFKYIITPFYSIYSTKCFFKRSKYYLIWLSNLKFRIIYFQFTLLVNIQTYRYIRRQLKVIVINSNIIFFNFFRKVVFKVIIYLFVENAWILKMMNQ